MFRAFLLSFTLSAGIAPAAASVETRSLC